MRGDAIGESVFFFQAEDGMRDVGVAGVETGALPIYHMLLQGVPGAEITPGHERDRQVFIGQPGDTIERARYVPPPPSELRSEERRVGTECRSRWSPYH